MNPSPLLAIPSERESLVGVVCSLLLLARLLLRVCLSLLPFFRTIHFLPSCASSSFQNKKFMQKMPNGKIIPIFSSPRTKKKKETKTRDKKKSIFFSSPDRIFSDLRVDLGSIAPCQLSPVSCLLSPVSSSSLTLLFI